MEPGCAKNSSSVARHLLLSDEQRFNPEMPSCSLRNAVEVKPEGNPEMKTQYGELSALDLILNRKPNLQPRKMVANCSISRASPLARDTRMLCYCELCERIRSLTFERLNAPLEEPYPSSGTSDRAARPPRIREAQAVIMNVRRFFKELKKELGDYGTGTVFKSGLVMASLACGVSMRTVERITKIYTAPACSTKKEDESAAILRKYGPEWGAVVRQFVLSEIEQYTYVDVPYLHKKLRYAFADFPLTLHSLYIFLKCLGFNLNKGDRYCYVIPGDETKIQWETETKDEEMESSCELDDEDEDVNSGCSASTVRETVDLASDSNIKNEECCTSSS